MAATGLALHSHAQLLPQRPALACQPPAGRVKPVRWGCATLGRAVQRRVQQDVFQAHAAATVDVEAVEAQLRGEVTQLLKIAHRAVIVDAYRPI